MLAMGRSLLVLLISACASQEIGAVGVLGPGASFGEAALMGWGLRTASAGFSEASYARNGSTLPGFLEFKLLADRVYT